MDSICSTVPQTGLLADSNFVAPESAPEQRGQLIRLYESAYQDVEKAKYSDAVVKLLKLDQDIKYWVRDPNQTALSILINDQIGKLTGL